MKKKFFFMLLLGSSLFVQACGGSIPSTDPDEDAADKRGNREEYAERAQDS